MLLKEEESNPSLCHTLSGASMILKAVEGAHIYPALTTLLTALRSRNCRPSILHEETKKKIFKK